MKEKKRRNRRTGETEETEEEGFRTGLGAVIMEAPPGLIRVSGIVRWSCHFGSRRCTAVVYGGWSKVDGARSLQWQWLADLGMADLESIGWK